MTRMPTLKIAALSLLGALLIHLALIACDRTGGSTPTADAAGPTSCSAWQITYHFSKTHLNTTTEGLGTPVTVPAGWEPMSILVYSEGLVTTVRKCVQ